MQYYFRDQIQNAGVMPMAGQNTGMMPMAGQNTGMMPMAGQNTGMMPMAGQNTGMMPMAGQNTGMMPMAGQNTGMMPMAGQFNPMMNMEEQQLESMYPNTYNIIQPHVENMCNAMEAQHGKKCPSYEEVNKMVDKIYTNVESEVEAAVKQGGTERERQFSGGGRRLLRDFIGVLLISDLIRRRRPFFGHPGFFGGYPYGGFPYGGYFY